MLVDFFWFIGGMFFGAGFGYVYGAKVKADILYELHTLRAIFEAKQSQVAQVGVAVKKVL